MIPPKPPMHQHFTPPVGLVACLPWLLVLGTGGAGGCGNSNTGPLHSDAPLAPTPHVAGDPPPRTLRRPGMGVMEVTAVEIVAEITAIDTTKRQFSVLMPDGKTQVIKASKQMRGFDEIKVGDRIAARIAEETALFVRRDGEPPSVQEADIVGIKVGGDRPAALESEAVEVTARVLSVDAKNQKVTLLFVGGREATINVHNAIDLTTVKPGDDLVARISERLMVEVIKK